MRKKIQIFIIFLFAIFIWIGGADIAQAQSVGIRISPVKFEELINPGETLNLELKVVNESDISKTLYVYLRDFKAEGESGHARLVVPGGGGAYSLTSWIEVNREGITFAPREEKIIPYKISAPADIGPGGYFGAIVMGTMPPKLHLDSEEKGAGFSIGQQTASLILLRVKGEVWEEAVIREFNTNKDFYSTPFDVDFLVRIENLGNVHVKPHGTIKISNTFGQEVAVVRVNETGGNILPGSTRKFSKILWSGRNGFGKYTAKLSLTYGTATNKGGQGKSSIFAAKSFWIIPWKIIIPIFLGLIIFSALVFLFLKLYKNKAIRRAMEQAGLGHMRYVKQYEGPSPMLHLSMVLLVIFIVLFLLLTVFYFLFFA